MNQLADHILIGFNIYELFYRICYIFNFTVTGTVATGDNNGGVISYSTPNSYHQFYSPNFAQFSPVYAAAPAAATPQVNIFNY